MKIVLAFDSFKGCMTADDACHTAAMAIRNIMAADVCNKPIEIVECPLSDGGEGLVDCVEHILPTERVHVSVHDPLMNIIDASYLVSHSSCRTSPANECYAYMEMASCAGLTLVSEDKRDPITATTYGVGEMIIDAVSRGCTHIVMGIGGSATCDGGRGMIRCLMDKKYLNAEGRVTNCKLSNCKFYVASDVTNPLYGSSGAAYVFAPQKGATPQQVEILDRQLQEFANETESLGLASHELSMFPGAGAAGGLGYSLISYLKAELSSGIDMILDINDFEGIIRDADLVITGEGKSDCQTLMGKVPFGVLQRCRRRRKVPVWLFSGTIDDKDHTLSRQFNLVKSINDGDVRPTHILMQTDVARKNLTKAIGVYIKNYIQEGT